jgi:hypothetical protein
MVGRAGNGTGARLEDADGEHELRRGSTDGGADGPVDGELVNGESAREKGRPRGGREGDPSPIYRERGEEERGAPGRGSNGRDEAPLRDGERLRGFGWRGRHRLGRGRSVGFLARR